MGREREREREKERTTQKRIQTTEEKTITMMTTAAIISAAISFLFLVSLTNLLGGNGSGGGGFLLVEAAGTNDAGLSFLQENKHKEGVIVLPSGLQYKVLTKGDGVAHPLVGTSCSCHYEGKLLDGTVFDSSYERGSPTSFAPNQVIKGWTEAMQLMVVGDKWEMYIPSELGYGDNGSPPKIGGGDVLIFIMEILAIEGESIPALTCSIVPLHDPNTNCNEREQKYVLKVTAWKKEDDHRKKTARELNRLKGLLEKPMTEELRDWARRRIHILQQFIQTKPTTENEL